MARSESRQTPLITVPPTFLIEPMTVRMSPQTVQSSRPALSMTMMLPVGHVVDVVADASRP